MSGEVLLELSIYDPILTAATEQQLYQRLMTLVAGSTILEQEEDDRAAVDGYDDDGATDARGESTDEEVNTAEQLDMPDKKRRRHKLARLRRKATQRAYEFRTSDLLDGVLFLEISRITDLPPESNGEQVWYACSNLVLTMRIVTRTSFDMDPFVVASLGKKTYKTKISRHNLNPVYDEKMLFHVMRHEVKYSLNFTVIDRDKLSGNDYVGSCDFAVEQVTALAPEADPATGLYRLREPVISSSNPTPPPLETRRSRFRIPSSRTSSTSSVSRTQPKTRMLKSESSTSLHDGAQKMDRAHDSSSSPPTFNPESLSNSAVMAADYATPEDTDLATFNLPLVLKHKEKWEDKHKPVLYIKARYMPYKALRQQFWRAMLKQYDADESGSINKVELTTMLDTLGSTLHESTIDSMFQNHPQVTAEQDEPSLTIDQAVMCLEELLETLQQKKKPWQLHAHHYQYHRHHRTESGAESARTIESSSSSRSQSPEFERSDVPPLAKEQPKLSNVPALRHAKHGSKGEEGDAININDLNDDNDEEHVVEIRECPICHQPRLKKKSDADIILHIATCASQNWRQVNNIMMAGFVTSSQARRKWYSKVVTKIGYGGYRLGANSANILVQDRITGQINEERMSVYVRLGIRLLYKGVKSRDMEKRKGVPLPHSIWQLSPRTNKLQSASCYAPCRSGRADATMIRRRPPKFKALSISTVST